MIFGSLLLFVVSFIITALLAPKPKLEDARAEGIDNLNFPRATEDAPIPLVLGDVWVEAVNTDWYGNFRNEAITEKVKTGLFSSKRVKVGYKYYISLDLGICLGPAELAGIRIDDADVSGGGTVNEVFQSASGPAIDILAGTASFPAPDPGNTFDLIGAGFIGDDIDNGQTLGDPGGLNGFVSLSYTYLSNPLFDFVTIDVRAYDAFMAPIFFSIFRVSNQTANLGPGNHTLSGNFNIPAGTRYLVFSGNYNALTLGDIIINSSSFTVTGPRRISSTGDIYEPELFGGEKNGGGWIGNFTFYPGILNQVQDPFLLSQLGDVPAYNGLCHIVMPNQYIGESVNLRKIAFRIQSYSDNLGLPNDGKIGTDINPAEALVEIIINKWRGLGKSLAKIDVDSFYDAGVVLYNEGLGISIQVTSTQNGKELVREILRHIDGIMWEDPETGLITLKLIRQDYDPDALLIFDESDIISIDNFTRTTWQDVISQIKVSYESREKQSSLTAIAQDMAIANMIGEIKTATVSFPFCYEGQVAANLAARELSQLSVPVFKMTLTMNRSGFQLRPGDVFKVSWPEYGITETILRVGTFDGGELLNNRMVFDCSQDIFAVNRTVFAPPEDSLWVDETSARPQEVLLYYAYDLPKAISDYVGLDFVDGQGYAVMMPFQPAIVTTSYVPVTGVDSGDLVYEEDEIGFPKLITLQAELDKLDGFEDGVIASLTADYNINYGEIDYPADADPFYYKGLIYGNDEWMGFDAAVGDGINEVTITNLYRGILGTTPKTHPIGTTFVIFEYGLIGDLQITSELTDSGVQYFKFASRNTTTVRDVTEDPEFSHTLTQISSSPVRPRDLQLDGTRTGAFVPAIAPIQDLTWVSSNREEFALEDDATQTPDSTEQYDIEIVNAEDGTVEFSASNVTSPYSIDFTTLSSLLEIRLWSRRTADGRVSPYYAFLPVEVDRFELLLEGDQQSGTDKLLLEGDKQSGTDLLDLSGVY